MSEDIFVKPPKEGEAWDVVIIGSGPASLTAAVYTTRGAVSTLIIGGEKWGGQLMLTSVVDNYPGFPQGVLGPELMLSMRKQAERFGAVFVEGTAEKVDFSSTPFKVISGEQTYMARSVIIATGATNVWLGVPGEYELIGKGVSSCAPCDAPFFRDKQVIVVGGGDSAMEEALVLSKYATKVTIVHRREQFRASVAMQNKVFKEPKISVLWNSEITQIIGETKVEKVMIKNTNTGEVSPMQAEGVFVAIGHKPECDIFKGVIDVDEKGYILRSGNGKQLYESATNIAGVFVAGDVHDFRFRQAITAAGYGCMAGMEAIKYLDELNREG